MPDPFIACTKENTEAIKRIASAVIINQLVQDIVESFCNLFNTEEFNNEETSPETNS